MLPANIRAVFFDAGHTLIEPTVAPLEVYYREAKLLDASLPREEFLSWAAAQWPLLNPAFRSKEPDLSTSEAAEKAAWHGFTWQIATAFPRLLQAHQDWHTRLVRYFDAPSAWKFMAGVPEVLQLLRTRGMVIGIVSNWHSVLHDILRGLGLMEFCDFVLTSAEAGYKKPHSEIFYTALRRAGATPEDTIHVGDSWDDDVMGALAVGIHPIYLERRAQPGAQGGTRDVGGTHDVPSIPCLTAFFPLR